MKSVEWILYKDGFMRKILAIIEILGGLLIFAAFLFLSGILVGHFSLQLENQGISHWSWTVILSLSIPIIFGLLVLFAGINLWRNKKLGYQLSLLAQIVQLFIVQSPNFYYAFYTIAGAFISFSKLGFVTNLGLGASFLISTHPQPVAVLYIGINIIALILLILLSYLYRRFLNQKTK
jgi:hypothetical protein